MILKFDGVLEIELVDDHYMTILIGGTDVIDAIRDAHFSGPVTVAVGGASFNGDLYVEEGVPDYSEYTPGDPPEICVGTHDIFPRLREMEGHIVTLWIADEPVNTLDPPPLR